MRPFIRWAGSKRLLLKDLIPLVPTGQGTYLEPFLGGGSLFLALRPRAAFVGDALDPLMDTWESVRANVDEVLSILSLYSFDEKTYRQVRATTPDTPVERAARFLYLNRGAYGGLWRLNRAGDFNVPWSKPKSESPIDDENLRRVSAYLGGTGITLGRGDFAAISSYAERRDVVFFDPPYSKGRPERPFIHYNKTLFDWEQQERLATEAHRLRAKGVTVIVTNSTHPDVASLYVGFRSIDVRRHSSLGWHEKSSRQISERIFFGE